ncbi:hypothetical protein [Deinococcus hohokamensis]|uniref:ABM domain-containing protein n=1 Tax=Deinococcus hohokamensis TaxID=309883 RepID=A0ABV9IDC9_9DEIO
MSAAVVWYVEARGEGALASLRAFLHTLQEQPGLLGAELLISPAQPGLALVASRWAQATPDLPLPPGARGWVFEVVESR